MRLLTQAVACRQTPAPAPASSSGLLAPLCAAGIDIAVLVLTHLELRDLAALARSSRSLHSLVADLPEPLWREAAQRAYPAEHPVMLAESVRAFMHTQHCAHSAIRNGRRWAVTRRSEMGEASPDCKLAVCVKWVDTLQQVLWIAVPITGQQQHCWPLPPLLPGQWYDTRTLWSPSSCNLVLGLNSQKDCLHSIMFVNAQSGSKVLEDLQHKEGLDAQVHSWSPAGLLLVSWTAPPCDTELSAYSCDVRRIASCSFPDRLLSAPAWSPSGEAVAFGGSRHSLWLWTLHQPCQCIASDCWVQAFAWAPSSSALLLFTHSSGCLRAHLWHLDTQASSRQLAAVTAGMQCAVSWAQQNIVLLCDRKGQGFQRLLLYDANEGVLTLLYALKARDSCVIYQCVLETMQPILFSGDGSHCLFIMFSGDWTSDEDDENHAEYELVVLNLRSMAQRSLQILPSEPHSWNWASDSSAVHVNMWTRGSLLLKFV